MAIAIPPMAQLRFSGHETFPLRQLWLRKAYRAVADCNGDPASLAEIFTDEAAIRRFGVGKNMVLAIRHWALATGVLEEDERNIHRAGVIGDLLFGERGVDQFLEHPTTPWLIHWQLSKGWGRSTTIYWIFNHITNQSFDETDVVAGLRDLVTLRSNGRLSETTLKRDVEVALRCYVARKDTAGADDAAEPLLADLALLRHGSNRSYSFRRGAQTTLSDGVFGYALMEYWTRWEASIGASQNTLSFESICHDHGSPGRVFKLDEHSVAERLINLETLSRGMIHWTDSAGIRQISRPDDSAQHRGLSISLLRKAYE